MAVTHGGKHATAKTEADKILAELKTEIHVLKERVQKVEQENEGRSTTEAELHFRREETKKLWQELTLEQEDAAENFQILAEMMHGMKNPVNGVVENLSDLRGTIADEEVKQSLDDCMETARRVLDHFERAENYCQALSNATEGTYSEIHLLDFIQQKVARLAKVGVNIKLYADPNIPKAPRVNAPLLNKTLDLVVEAFAEVLRKDNRIELKIYHNTDQAGYDSVKVWLSAVAEKPLAYLWRGSWKESLDIFGSDTERIPLDWLQCRNELKRANGHLKIVRKDKYIFGAEIQLPLESADTLQEPV